MSLNSIFRGIARRTPSIASVFSSLPRGGRALRRSRISRTQSRCVIALALLTSPALAEDGFLGTDFASFTGEVQFEVTGFAEEPRFAGQEDAGVSFAVRPKLVLEWNETVFGGADAVVTITPFLRVDAHDRRRTHADLREAKLDLRFGETDVTIGNDFVFWGKTEVDQIVDIINQTDGVEGTDGEDKLGQPMIRLTRLVDIGDVFSGEASLYYLPYFRERTFLGTESRLRPGIIVDGTDPEYETGAEEWTPSFAGRLAGFVGDFDVGVSVFHGLSRDPAFRLSDESLADPMRAPELTPVYGRITQVGIDGQYTSGATLWKAEAIGRWNQRNLAFEREDYVAVIAGLEHTLYGIADSNADLGLIAEYAYDSRGDEALTVFENDLVLGARLALNDTQDTSALFTATVDTDDAETLLRLEAERRLTDIASLSLEAGAFLNTDDNSLADDLQDDHFLRATLSVFW